MTTIRWGIVGTGWISDQFATDVVRYAAKNDTDIKHVITHVGSSTTAKAEAFVGTLNALQKSLGSEVTEIKASGYADLYKSDVVDIIYVGSPHVNHMENCLQAIENKKSILCEKPVTVNAKQLKQILDAAKKNGVFFMEALWVRFFPANRKLIDLVYGDSKILGDVKTVTSKYCFNVRDKTTDPEHRLLKKSLGGGASLDIGVYPLTYLRMYVNPESDPLKDWNIDQSKLILDSYTGNEEDNVDFSCTASFSIPKYSQKAHMEASFLAKSDPYELCVIEGTKGTARICHADFPSTWEYTIEVDGQKTVEKFENPVPETNGFYFQVIAVGEALAKGLKETDIVPWSDSVAEMTILDKIRYDSSFLYDEDK